MYSSHPKSHSKAGKREMAGLQVRLSQDIFIETGELLG